MALPESLFPAHTRQISYGDVFVEEGGSPHGKGDQEDQVAHSAPQLLVPHLEGEDRVADHQVPEEAYPHRHQPEGGESVAD